MDLGRSQPAVKTLEVNSLLWLLSVTPPPCFETVVFFLSHFIISLFSLTTVLRPEQQSFLLFTVGASSPGLGRLTDLPRSPHCPTDVSRTRLWGRAARPVSSRAPGSPSRAPDPEQSAAVPRSLGTEDDGMLKAAAAFDARLSFNGPWQHPTAQQ